MYPGIFGDDRLLMPARRGFRGAGIESGIYNVDWERVPVLGTFDNLVDEAGNRHRAQKLAEQVTAYRRTYPQAPIDLVAYSGGAGLLVMTIEALPDDVFIRHTLLVQGALSPTYDLTDCLEHIDGTLVNLYCPTDWLFLGAGTQVMGTTDRVHTASTGKVASIWRRACLTPR